MEQQRVTVPPYCPNIKCRYHSKSDEIYKQFQKFGLYRATWTHGYAQQRWRCTECKHVFCEASFSFSYRLKKRTLYEKVATFAPQGLSNRAIAKLVEVSEPTVRLHLKRIARAAIEFHTTVTKDTKIREPIVYDGVENFSKSQYDPNNINHAIGANSFFVYDFSFCAFNRKGKMSPYQRLRKAEIEASMGRYHPSSIRLATTRLLNRLLAKVETYDVLIFRSDRHFQYRKSIEIDLKHHRTKIDHNRTSAKDHRGYWNPLFPINHMDTLLRHQSKAFARETLAFSKTPGAMCQKYILYAVHKNYARSAFVKNGKPGDPRYFKSPAELAGILNRKVTLGEMCASRSFLHRLGLDKEWDHYFNATDPDPRILSTVSFSQRPRD